MLEWVGVSFPRGSSQLKDLEKTPQLPGPAGTTETTRGPPGPRSRGCTPQARLGGQLLKGTSDYGFIYRFMGGETTQKPDAPCTPQPGLGGEQEL